jgi:rare lipoprotein A
VAVSGAIVPEQSQLPAPGEQAGYRLPSNTFLQLGAFARQLSAQTLQARVKALTPLPVKLLNKPGANGLWRVQVGPVVSNLVVMNLRETLASEGLSSGHLVYE